jgi:serine phosphatase RsbU (regulator of sigma subunit)
MFGLIILFTSNILVYNFSNHLNKSKVMDTIESKFDEREEYFLTEIDRYKILLESILNSDVFYSYVYKWNIEGINNVFLARLKGEKDIFRLRFIDTEGQELVSIKKQNGSIDKFPLQDKSNRYYYQDTKNLKKGDIWFSKIDLNRDFGVLEKPIRPTLRLIMPVFIDNKKKGILVLNISMQSILQNLSKTSLYNIAIVDKDGEFIYHECKKHNLSWSRYLDKKHSLKESMPNDYKNILSNKKYIGDDFLSNTLNFDNGEGLKLILIVKDSILKSNANDLMKIIVGCIIVTILIAFIFLYFISNKINCIKIEHEEEIKNINQNLRDSINVASIIQSSILPSDDFFKQNFDDYFIYYQPKDIVSGDIYLVKKINDKEFILMIIDCTGHGVSGAFLTMFIKAISKDLHYFMDSISLTKEVSTSYILSIFNKQIKDLLKQSYQVHSDFGCDGAILYINREKNFAKYSGANCPIYIEKDGKVEIIKANRHSIGYKKSDINYIFNEKIIDLSQEQIIYLTTDGFIDQLGGNKGFPFAKKRFVKLIEENYHKSLKEQKDIFIDYINKYQANYENIDDRTVIALKF